MGVSHKEACPKCQEEGRDRSGDNLAVYDDGGAFCFSCGYRRLKGSTAKPKSEAKTSLTLEQVMTYPHGADPTRKLDAAIVSDFDIRVSHNAETGDVDKVYYIYTDNDGKPCNFKRKRLSDKSFITGGTLPGLYGKAQCTGTDYLIVTEGEEDTHAVKGLLQYPPVGLKAIKYDTVSLPNGANRKTDRAPRIEPELLAELDWLQQYKRVYLIFDSDEAGKYWSTVIADWMCKAVEVRVVTLDKTIGKDASDYLRAGAYSEFREAIRDNEVYEPDGVVAGEDISISELVEPIPEGYTIPWSGLNDRLKGLRKAEIVTICAASGIGKSTMLREMMYSLTEQGAAIANIALEDQMNVAAQAMVALDMHIPLHRFRFHPPSEEEIKPSYEKMVANGRTYFYKHFGGLTCDTLINRLQYYIRSKKVDFICLDHLSMVVSASDSQNERKDIDKLMTQLAQLVTETGVGLIQVVHLKRVNTRDGKSFAKGGEVELTDLRGSAALEQLSWSVIGLERDQQGDDSDFIQVRLLKNRTVGYTGPCDLLKYDTLTGRLKSADSDLDHDVDTSEVLDEDEPTGSMGTGHRDEDGYVHIEGCSNEEPDDGADRPVV